MVQKNNLKKHKILVIVGPTGVGKSDYGVDLALRYNGEVISADSVQIYKMLNVGSGKISKDEMRGVPHYLLDKIEPDEPYTVVDFMNSAKSLIEEISSRGKLPIIVGGTGFYVNALLHGYICGTSAPDQDLRKKIKTVGEKYGIDYLYDTMRTLNPKTKINQNDLPRIVRALELEFTPENNYGDEENNEEYNALMVIMDADREKLDEKAKIRIDKMFNNGFLQEVKNLSSYYNCRCMQSVGYFEAMSGIKRGLSEEEIKRDMRLSYHALIKKQQTFFRWIKWNKKTTVYNWNYLEAEGIIKEFLNERTN